MGSRKLLFVAAALGLYQACLAQSPTYGLGKTPTAAEIQAWDITISPTGKELPPGRGTAKEGAALYVSKGCGGCHGPNGNDGHAPTLIRSKDPKAHAAMPCLTPCVNDSNAMAIHSPYATVIWDYIHRAMPLGEEESLTPNEVYSLTAYLLFKNDVIKEDQVMDQQSLPKVKMPNANGFALPPEPWKHGEPRLQGYP
jgi:S-disulfanyl-L-cysteine oxidoreductase SoxD